MQILGNSGGLTAYGAQIALSLLAVVVLLLLPVCLGQLKARTYVASATPLVFLIVFFWLWPTITEISLGKFGSIKTNVEQALAYLKQLQAIQAQVADIKDQIKADAKAAHDLREETKALRAAQQAELEQMAPRSFTPNELLAITGVAKRFPGISFDLSMSLNPESLALLMQLKSALEQAGWNWIPQKNGGGLIVFRPTGEQSVSINAGFVGLGIEISASAPPEWRTALNALTSEINKTKVRAMSQVTTNEGVSPDAFHIVVGSKP